MEDEIAHSSAGCCDQSSSSETHVEHCNSLPLHTLATSCLTAQLEAAPGIEPGNNGLQSSADEASESAETPGNAGVYDELPIASDELPGLLPGHSNWNRAALLALARQWSTLPEELKLAVLRVAGVDVKMD